MAVVLVAGGVINGLDETVFVGVVDVRLVPPGA
jgi:hypothetical protein